jgi:uncharacterized membrane protein
MQAHSAIVAWISSAQNSATNASEKRIGPIPLIATTADILVVMWRRRFASQSRAAVRDA